MNKVLDVKLHECFSGFCDTLYFFRAVHPNQEKFSLEYLVSHSEKFIQRSWCSGEFQSVTKTLWVALSCGWCPLFISYNWCIKYLWYFVLANPSQTVLWNFETTSFIPHNFWLRMVVLSSFKARILKKSSGRHQESFNRIANAMSELQISSVSSFFKER